MSTASPNPFGWVEIYVDDMPRARAFYSAVFQRPLEDLPDPTGQLQMVAFSMAPDGAGAAGALVKMAQMKPGLGGTLAYFSCDDCAVNAERAAKAGGRVVQPKRSIGPYGFIAMVNDTEGNLIGLHSQT